MTTTPDNPPETQRDARTVQADDARRCGRRDCSSRRSCCARRSASGLGALVGAPVALMLLGLFVGPILGVVLVRSRFRDL